MAGMLSSQQPQVAPQGGGADMPTKIQVMLIKQPIQLLYQKDSVAKLLQAMQHADPAKVIAAAAIAAVMGSAQAGMRAGARFTNEQIGNAVLEVLQALVALLVKAKIVQPDQVDQIIQQAAQLATQMEQQQQGGAGGGPGPAAGAQSPGPAGQPPAMAAGGPGGGAPMMQGGM